MSISAIGFGFTDDEVKGLLEYYGLENSWKTVRNGTMATDLAVLYLLSVGCDEILSGAAEESRCYTGKLLGKYEWK